MLKLNLERILNFTITIAFLQNKFFGDKTSNNPKRFWTFHPNHIFLQNESVDLFANTLSTSVLFFPVKYKKLHPSNSRSDFRPNHFLDNCRGVNYVIHTSICRQLMYNSWNPYVNPSSGQKLDIVRQTAPRQNLLKKALDVTPLQWIDH
jgi:hypothetical protein